MKQIIQNHLKQIVQSLLEKDITKINAILEENDIKEQSIKQENDAKEEKTETLSQDQILQAKINELEAQLKQTKEELDKTKVKSAEETANIRTTINSRKTKSTSINWWN